MSIQDIREAVKGFRTLEHALNLEKGCEVVRGERWEQAKTVTMWLNGFEYWIERAYKMAGAKVPPKVADVEWKGFINYVLSEADKEQYTQWDVDDHDLWLLVAGHQQCGYKLTVSFNSKNDTFNANYICNDPSSPNKGYCLSAFAPDWYNAVKILAYKHDVVLDGLWVGKESKQKNNWG